MNERFQPWGKDADHAAMLMDRRPLKEQIKSLLRLILNKNIKWEKPETFKKLPPPPTQVSL